MDLSNDMNQYQMGGQGMGEYGATEPIIGQGFDGMNPGVTMPPMGESGFTQPVENPGFGDNPAFNNAGFGDHGFGGDQGGFAGEDYGATEVAYVNGVQGFSPVAGWLVCIDGPNRGRDYRVHPGYNTIGSDAHMDICITGDRKISREKHAMIAYDPDENVYFFGPVDGKNLVKLNGRLVMMPSELKAYDVLTIGSSKLMFVPLCGEKFSWKDV